VAERERVKTYPGDGLAVVESIHDEADLGRNKLVYSKVLQTRGGTMFDFPLYHKRALQGCDLTLNSNNNKIVTM
jgi:hypothetical protein